nr:helix-turn-helix transcriptional regulator [Phocaeicola vulgatus]
MIILHTFVFKFIDLQNGNLNRIKVVLVEKKRTAKWLAEELEKSPATVSKWCTNVSQPVLYTLDKIATLRDIDKRELITGKY